MAEASVHEAKRSTRRHRCDEDFLELLEQDFGIAQFALRLAFLGMPPAPKRQAIGVCEWVTVKTSDPNEAGQMIRAWAKRRGVGQYHPAIMGAPAPTFGGSEATGFEMEGRVMRAPASPSQGGIQVHHRIPRCLLRLRDQADTHTDLDGAALQEWLDYEAEALEHGVDPDLSRDELAELIESSTVGMPTEEHRALHSGAGHFREWGRRGGVKTLSRYGRPWFALLALRRWEKVEAEALAKTLEAMRSKPGRS